MGHYIEGQTMSKAFYATVRDFPGHTAQVFNPDLYRGDNDGHFTWREVQERVEKMACGLLHLGLDKKERVAIIAGNSPHWTHTDVAVVNCGAVLVTIYPTLSLREISYIVNDSASKYLFVGSEDILGRIMPGLQEMPSLQKIIVLDLKYQSSDPRIISLSDLIKLGSTNAKMIREYETRWQANTLDDWATILYTSGTTGQGKGVILSHGSLQSRMDGTIKYFAEVGHPLNEDDRVLSFLPLSHIFDRGCSQWTAIWVGASIAYADNVANLMADLPKYNPTWFSCVPRLYEKIFMTFQQQLKSSNAKAKLFDWALGVGEKVLQYRTDDHGRINMTAEFDVKSKLPTGLRLQYAVADKLFAKIRALFGSRFRFAFSASAGIAPDLLRFFYIMGLPVMEGYGLTETASACCYNPMFGAKPGTIGPAACGSQVRLAEDGELETTGAGMFLGYLNKPEDTEEAFTPDGWFKTGDLAIKDQDGYFKIVDRKKSIICLATGKNVAPAKIESLFVTDIEIDQVFVMGDEKTHIAALIVPNFNHFVDRFQGAGQAISQDRIKYGETNGANLVIEVDEDFVEDSYLKQKIEELVGKANQKLENFERIKTYRIITRRFMEETGELTPTQKTKKRAILENYKELIEELYQRK